MYPKVLVDGHVDRDPFSANDYMYVQQQPPQPTTSLSSSIILILILPYRIRIHYRSCGSHVPQLTRL